MAARELETGTKLPSVEPLNRVILCWDFYKDITDDKHAKLEHGQQILQRSIKAAHASLGKESTESETLNIKQLPTRFSSEDDYINRFYPLFLLETMQSIHRAKEMEMENPEIVVQLGAEGRDGFFVLTLQRSDNSSANFYSSDLGLLYLDAPPDEATSSTGDAYVPLDDPLTAAAASPSTPNVNHALFIVESQ